MNFLYSVKLGKGLGDSQESTGSYLLHDNGKKQTTGIGSTHEFYMLIKKSHSLSYRYCIITI